MGVAAAPAVKAAVARADNAPYTLNWNNFGSPDVGVFLGPSLGVDQVNGETFGAALPLAGGIEEYSFKAKNGKRENTSLFFMIFPPPAVMIINGLDFMVPPLDRNMRGRFDHVTGESAGTASWR